MAFAPLADSASRFHGMRDKRRDLEQLSFAG